LAITDTMARRIYDFGGAALIADYGHARHGLGDTLQAVSRHAFAPVLENIGKSDITAHVDFAALRRAALPHAAVHGPVTQGDFLKNIGIIQRAETLARAAKTETQRKDIETALYRLTSAGEM